MLLRFYRHRADYDDRALPIAPLGVCSPLIPVTLTVRLHLCASIVCVWEQDYENCPVACVCSVHSSGSGLRRVGTIRESHFPSDPVTLWTLPTTAAKWLTWHLPVACQATLFRVKPVPNSQFTAAHLLASCQSANSGLSTPELPFGLVPRIALRLNCQVVSVQPLKLWPVKSLPYESSRADGKQQPGLAWPRPDRLWKSRTSLSHSGFVLPLPGMKCTEMLPPIGYSLGSVPKRLDITRPALPGLTFTELPLRGSSV